jgi:hypothetical protein
MNRCKGQTLVGKRCKRRVSRGEYCYIHMSQNPALGEVLINIEDSQENKPTNRLLRMCILL